MFEVTSMRDLLLLMTALRNYRQLVEHWSRSYTDPAAIDGHLQELERIDRMLTMISDAIDSNARK